MRLSFIHLTLVGLAISIFGSGCRKGNIQIQTFNRSPADQNENQTPAITASPCQTDAEGARLVAYESTVFPILRNRCSGCHGASQAPLFAVSDLVLSFRAAESRMDESDPLASRLAARSSNGHCGIDECKGDINIMADAIAQYYAEANKKITEAESQCGTKSLPKDNPGDPGPSKRAQVGIADRFYLTNVLIDIFGPLAEPIAHKNVLSKHEVFGGPCDVYENSMNRIGGRWIWHSQANRCFGDSYSATTIARSDNNYANTQTSTTKPSNTVRSGWKIAACESILNLAESRKFAIEKFYHRIGQEVDGNNPPHPNTQSIFSAYQLFYPEQPLNGATRISLQALANGVSEPNDVKWKWILLALCMSNGWEVP